MEIMRIACSGGAAVIYGADNDTTDAAQARHVKKINTFVAVFVQDQGANTEQATATIGTDDATDDKVTLASNTAGATCDVLCFGYAERS